MRLCMNIALPLVFIAPNSSCLPFPGNANSKPGWSSTNSTTPTSTGAQSAISLVFLDWRRRPNFETKKECGWAFGGGSNEVRGGFVRMASWRRGWNWKGSENVKVTNGELQQFGSTRRGWWQLAVLVVASLMDGFASLHPEPRNG